MAEKASPANKKLELPKGYRPLSTGQLRLEVPDKDGWHRHWFRGTSERLARAQQAGYRFVDPDDVDVNNFDIAGDSKSGGSTDLGSRVSVISGDDAGPVGQAGRMYLMECPEELYEYAQSILKERSEGIAEALRGGMLGVGKYDVGKDASNRYTKNHGPSSLFNKR